MKDERLCPRCEDILDDTDHLSKMERKRYEAWRKSPKYKEYEQALHARYQQLEREKVEREERVLTTINKLIALASDEQKARMQSAADLAVYVVAEHAEELRTLIDAVWSFETRDRFDELDQKDREFYRKHIDKRIKRNTGVTLYGKNPIWEHVRDIVEKSTTPQLKGLVGLMDNVWTEGWFAGEADENFTKE